MMGTMRSRRSSIILSVFSLGLAIATEMAMIRRQIIAHDGENKRGKTARVYRYCARRQEDTHQLGVSIHIISMGSQGAE
jgi:hypothetical protein